jgi:hypothetical protein
MGAGGWRRDPGSAAPKQRPAAGSDAWRLISRTACQSLCSGSSISSISCVSMHQHAAWRLSASWAATGVHRPRCCLGLRAFAQTYGSHRLSNPSQHPRTLPLNIMPCRIEQYSQELDRPYFFNLETSESTWERPADLSWRRIPVQEESE